MINNEKIKNLILYFSSSNKIAELGKTKLYKLIFFVDSHAYKLYGNTITGDKYLKFPMGPVPLSVSGIIHDMELNSELKVSEALKGNYFITQYTPMVEPNINIFSKDEVAIINDVIEKYGNKSRKELINLSHTMESWISADDYSELDFSKDATPSAEIFVKEYNKDIEILSQE